MTYTLRITDPDSRVRWFLENVGTVDVQVKSPSPRLAKVHGHTEKQHVYELDLDVLTEVQFNAFVARLAHEGESHAQTAARLREKGIPVLARGTILTSPTRRENVSVSVHVPVHPSRRGGPGGLGTG